MEGRVFRAVVSAGMAALILGGCAGADDLLFHGAYGEAARRGQNERRYKADVQACGRGPGSEWCRLAADDGNLSRIDAGRTKSHPLPQGAYAFDASQCDGVFSHGLCRGTVRPRVSQTPECHGQIIDDVCSQPEF